MQARKQQQKGRAGPALPQRKPAPPPKKPQAVVDLLSDDDEDEGDVTSVPDAHLQGHAAVRSHRAHLQGVLLMQCAEQGF